jgi:dihydropteroate synthase
MAQADAPEPSAALELAREIIVHFPDWGTGLWSNPKMMVERIDAFAAARVAEAVAAERARWFAELDKRIEKAEHAKGDPFVWVGIAGMLRGFRAFMQQGDAP